MKCVKCGAELINGARFCNRCGSAQPVQAQPGQQRPVQQQSMQQQPMQQQSGQQRPMQQQPMQQRSMPQGGQPMGGSTVPPMGNSGMPAPPQSYNRLPTDRSILLYILLNAITCGIYGLYWLHKLAQDVNICCAGDGNDATEGLGALIGYSILTCGVFGTCWTYGIVNRVRVNSRRYGVPNDFNGLSYLLWSTVGSCLCGVGPIIAMNKLCKATNALCDAYNRYNHLG